MPGGDFIFAIAVLVLGLLGAGELLIRAVEGLIAPDPYAKAHGDIAAVPGAGPIQANPGPGADELQRLRDRGAL